MLPNEISTYIDKAIINVIPTIGSREDAIALFELLFDSDENSTALCQKMVSLAKEHDLGDSLRDALIILRQLILGSKIKTMLGDDIITMELSSDVLLVNFETPVSKEGIKRYAVARIRQVKTAIDTQSNGKEKDIRRITIETLKEPYLSIDTSSNQLSDNLTSENSENSEQNSTASPISAILYDALQQCSTLAIDISSGIGRGGRNAFQRLVYSVFNLWQLSCNIKDAVIDYKTTATSFTEMTKSLYENPHLIKTNTKQILDKIAHNIKYQFSLGIDYAKTDPIAFTTDLMLHALFMAWVYREFMPANGKSLPAMTQEPLIQYNNMFNTLPTQLLDPAQIKTFLTKLDVSSSTLGLSEILLSNINIEVMNNVLNTFSGFITKIQVPLFGLTVGTTNVLLNPFLNPEIIEMIKGKQRLIVRPNLLIVDNQTEETLSSNPTGTTHTCQDVHQHAQGSSVDNREEEVHSSNAAGKPSTNQDAQRSSHDVTVVATTSQPEKSKFILLVEKFKLDIPREDIDIEEKMVGRGGFSIVYKGTWQEKNVAVKHVLPHESLRTTTQTPDEKLDLEVQKSFEQEVRILAQLDHPNIVRLYKICLQPRYIVMELMEKGSLSSLIHGKETITSELRDQIVFDIAKGLSYLHNQEAVHRDVKSANILLDSNYCAKLSDFGLSRFSSITPNTFGHKAGTFEWRAPELFDNNRYTYACDIYSYGMVIWEIVTRSHPYGNISDKEMVVNNVKNGIRAAIPENTPKFFKQLIKGCWDGQPAKRVTINNIVTRLESKLTGSTSVDSQQTARPDTSISSGERAYLENEPQTFFSPKQNKTTKQPVQPEKVSAVANMGPK